MTTPNLISFVRVLLVPVIMALILAGFDGHDRWAAAAYCVAAASDSLDGYLARSRGWITVAGTFLDPLADKLLVTGAMFALVQQGKLSSWPAMAIVAREFAVTGLRMIAAANQDVISAAWPGKLKALSQNLMIVVLLLVPSHNLAVDALILLAVLLSYWSMLGYAARAMRHFWPTGTRPAGNA